MTHPGIFTISLDFELHWGVFDKMEALANRQYFMNTRERSIPGMLRLFEQAGVGVTWATVGMLMHKGRLEFESNQPAVWPAYEQASLGMHHYISQMGIGDDESNDPYHFANSLCRQIVATPRQELATHTFAHYYCNEPGQHVQAFAADMKSAVQVQQMHFGFGPKSIVFPRNQFSPEHIEVCNSMGLTNFRSNPEVWWWKVTTQGAETRQLRLMRGADAYVKLGGPFSYSLNKVHRVQGLWSLPASRLLRAYHPRFGMLEKARLHRIKQEMTYAAQQQQVYHLWWHPHNFGWFPQQNLDALYQITEHYAVLKQKFGMTSMTMAETAAWLNQHRTS